MKGYSQISREEILVFDAVVAIRSDQIYAPFHSNAVILRENVFAYAVSLWRTALATVL